MQRETAFRRIPDEALTASDPPHLYPDYVGTRLRAPEDPLVLLPASLSELTGPVYGDSRLSETDADLTRQHSGEPLGERITVSGRVLGSDGKPLRGQLVEIWQANAAGRYRHDVDTHDAPLDPNFSGGGRCLTEDDGSYRFVTVAAGCVPVGEPPKRVEAEAHPLLALRPRLPGATRDADVLPGRPPLPVRSDLQLGSRRAGTSSG